LPGYHVLLIAGLLLAGLLAAWRGRTQGVPSLVVLDSTLAAAIGGMLVGRVAYVAANWAYFRDHLSYAPRVWQGGLSAHGVLLGAVGALILLSGLRRTDPRPLLDLLAPSAALLAGAAWLGCLQAGCAWGIETRPDQGLLWNLSMELPDLYGLRAPRVAVQVLGAGWSSVVLLSTLVLRRRGRPFPLWLLLHSVGDFGLGFLRGDRLPMVGALSLPQIADLMAALIGAALLTLPGWRPERERG